MPKYLYQQCDLTIEGIKVGLCSFTVDRDDDKGGQPSVEIHDIYPPRLRDQLRYTCRVFVQLANKRFMERQKRKR